MTANPLEDLICDLRGKLIRERQELEDEISRLLAATTIHGNKPIDYPQHNGQSYAAQRPEFGAAVMNRRQTYPAVDRNERDGASPLGLPGLGQYEEKRKKFEEEWRQECRKHLTQESTRPQRNVMNDSNTLDYAEILAQKRKEERRYRYMNGDSLTTNGVATNSNGADHNQLMQRPDPNRISYHQSGPGQSLHSEAEQIVGTGHSENYNIGPLGTQNGAQHEYNQINQQEHNYYDRPHTYPSPFNAVGGYDAARPFANENYYPESEPVYQHHASNIHSNGHGRSNSLPQDIKWNDKNPETMQWNSTTNTNRPPSGVFVTLNPHNGIKSSPNTNQAASYQNELMRQMADVKIRKEKERQEQIKYDQKIEEENRNYNPWGRGGAGAPMKDFDGNVITLRKQLGQGQKAQNIVQARESKQPSDEDVAVPIQHTPLPSRSRATHNMSSEEYHVELARQIEEKKRRDLIEKAKEQEEETKLMRRIEDQQSKMFNEYEAEIMKQRAREEELRLRNEELRRIQEQQRVEAQKKQREEREASRKEWWEAQQAKTLKPDQTTPNPDTVAKDTSPPIPTVQKKNNKTQEKSTHGSITHEIPRDHILSQLSTLRRQLEQEQKELQEQLRRQRAGNYEVYERRAPPQSSKKSELPEVKHDRQGTTEARHTISSNQTAVPLIQSSSLHGPDHTRSQKRQDNARNGYRGDDFRGGGHGELHASREPHWEGSVVKNNYASLQSLEGESIFIGMDDEHRASNDHEMPGPSRARNGLNVDQAEVNYQHRRLPTRREGQGYYDMPDEDNDDDVYLDRFMVKNLPR